MYFVDDSQAFTLLISLTRRWQQQQESTVLIRKMNHFTHVPQHIFYINNKNVTVVVVIVVLMTYYVYKCETCASLVEHSTDIATGIEERQTLR